MNEEFMVFILSFITLLIVLIFHPGLVTIDEIVHFTISKSAVVDPSALLAPFGKPLFTLLSLIIILMTTPASGILTIRLVNIIMVSITCACIYRIAMMENIKRKWIILGIIMMFFNPEFIMTSISALTEPLFILIFMIAYYYYKKDNYTVSSILYSLSFLVRNEAAIFIIIMAFKLLRIKKYLQILMLGIFPALWGLSLLLINKNPLIILLYNSYLQSIEVSYKDEWIPGLGEGISSIFYYLINTNHIFGWIPFIFLIIGMIVTLKKRKEIILVFNIACLYIFHTVIFMLSELGTSGISRYFYPIIPMCCLMYIYALGYLHDFIIFQYKRAIEFGKRGNLKINLRVLKTFKILYPIVVILLCFSTITPFYNDFFQNQSPTKQEYEIQDQAGQFLLENYNLKNQTVFCPIFGLTHLTTFLYKPTSYIDLEMNDRDTGDIVQNYTTVKMNGYFVGCVFEQNLTQIRSGDLLIWFNINDQFSYFNPANGIQENFDKIFNRQEGIYELIIYLKK